MERNFRLDDRPLARECNTTSESTRRRKREPTIRLWHTLHFKVVRTALISRTLMCSWAPLHFHPETIRHFQRRGGIEERKRWNFTNWLEGVESMMSSPLTLIKLPSWATNVLFSRGASPRRGRSGARHSRVCKKTCCSGSKKITMSWGVYLGQRPSGPHNWPRKEPADHWYTPCIANEAVT